CLTNLFPWEEPMEPQRQTEPCFESKSVPALLPVSSLAREIGITFILFTPFVLLAADVYRRKAVDAERLSLVDGNGRIRAEIGFQHSDPLFALFDTDKRVQLSLRLKDDTPLFGLAGKNETARLLCLVQDNQARFALVDDRKKPRLLLLERNDSFVSEC